MGTTLPHVYVRALYQGLPASDELVDLGPVDLGDWADKIYCSTSEKMSAVPDNSVGLAFTSPPYNVGKSIEREQNACQNEKEQNPKDHRHPALLRYSRRVRLARDVKSGALISEK